MKRTKTGGRTVGTPNKTTADVRKLIHELLNSIDLKADLQSLPTDKRIEIVIKLLPYVCSKYKEISDNDNSLFAFL